MTAKDLVVDDGGDGKAIKAVGECLPQFDGKSSLALVVKSVNSDKIHNDMDDSGRIGTVVGYANER